MKKDRIADCIKHGEEQFAAQSAADKQKQNQFIIKTKIEVNLLASSTICVGV